MNAAIKFEKEMDRDGDGIITAEEVQVATAYEKATIQSRITIASFIVIVILTALLLSGAIPDSRITALSGLISTLFVALAGIIGAFFGMQAWMSRK